MNWTEQGVSALVVFILAAILGPRDFGLVAMAAIFTGFLEMFLDQGMTTALIQHKDPEPVHFDAVFWVLIATSLAMVAITLALSPWWSRVNNVPELSIILNVLVLRLPIGALSRVHATRFLRSMDYRSLALRNSASVSVGGLVGIVLALTGFGPWSIVVQGLCRECVGTLLIWRLSPWRPRLRFSFRHARELFGFSSATLLARIGIYTGQEADGLLIGLFFGPTAVGVYRLAGRIVGLALQMLTRPLQTVSLPELCRQRADPDRVRASLLGLMRASLTVAVPALAIVAACSEPIMQVVGSQWAAASSVLSVLCLGGVVQIVTQFDSPALQAASRPFLLAAIVWAQGIINAAVFASIAFALQSSASETTQMLTLAAGRVAVLALGSLPFTLWITLPLTGLNGRDVLHAGWRALASALTAGAAATNVLRLGEELGVAPIARLACATFTGVGLGTVVLLAIDSLFRARIVGAFLWLRRKPAPDASPVR